MATEKRGVQQIKTMARLVDARRTRTSSGALLELSMLEMEKQRLFKEMQRAERRCLEIRTRMADIETKQQWLQRFVDRSVGEILQGQPTATSSGWSGSALPAASPLPIHSAPTDRLKRRQLAY